MKFDPRLVDEIREICLVEFPGTAAVKILKLLAERGKDVFGSEKELAEDDSCMAEAVRYVLGI